MLLIKKYHILLKIFGTENGRPYLVDFWRVSRGQKFIFIILKWSAKNFMRIDALNYIIYKRLGFLDSFLFLRKEKRIFFKLLVTFLYISYLDILLKFSFANKGKILYYFFTVKSTIRTKNTWTTNHTHVLIYKPLNS